MLNDDWIYVGKADATNTRRELANRIRDHAGDERFQGYLQNIHISYCIWNNPSDMNIVEKMLIKIHKPVINVKDATDSILPFSYDESAIEWHDYKSYRGEQISYSAINPDLYRDFILSSFLDEANPKTFIHYGMIKAMEDDRDNCVYNDLIRSLVSYIENCGSLCYPCCKVEVSIPFAELKARLMYHDRIKISTFSRKLKEINKIVFYPTKQNPYDIHITHTGDTFTFEIKNLNRDVSDVLWDIENSLYKLYSMEKAS